MRQRNTVLRAQIQDMEHRAKLLEEEKARADAEMDDHLAQLSKGNDDAQTAVADLSKSLGEKEGTIKDKEAEAGAYAKLIEEKQEMIQKLRQDLAERLRQRNDLAGKLREAQGQAQELRVGREVSQARSERLKAENDSIDKRQAELREAGERLAEKAAGLRQSIDELAPQIADAKAEAEQLDNELQVAREGRRNTEQDSGALLSENNKLRNEKDRLEAQMRFVQMKLEKIDTDIRNARIVSDERDRELHATLQQQVAPADLERLKHDNEMLYSLLDKYHNDASVQRALKDKEARERLEIEQEKRRMETQARQNEMLARSAEKELERARDVHEAVAERQQQVSQELEALQGHATVLESQNQEVMLDAANVP